jgi:zinc transport system ATP-binding protein
VTALVTLSNVTVRLEGEPVLSGVTLAIRPGEIVTIVGPNGSGKTTLLRTILGAVRPASGTVSQRPGLRLGYVPQKLAVDTTLPLTVRRFLGLPVRRSSAEVAAVLEAVGAEQLAGSQITGLSGGELQRVLLARALSDGPDLLILDEPTANLDQPGSAAFYRLIERLRDDLGCAVLMVSHELHVVMSASDRVICLNGHICCEGAPAVVASAPEYRALFGPGTGGALALYRHEHDHTHEHHAHGDHGGHGH